MKKSLYFAFFSIFAFFCVFKPVFAHTVNWYADNNIYTTTCESGENVTPPNAPAKYGYTFKEWQPEYILYDYINFTGTQFIDTGIVFDTNTNEIEYDVKFTVGNVTGYNKLFGACDSSGYGSAVNSSGTIIKTSYNGYEVKTFVGNYSSPVLTNVSDPSEYKIVLNRQDSNVKTYIGGILSNTGNFTGSLSTNTIYLGAIHTDSGATGNWFGNVYYFSIKKDGVLVGEFVPAKHTTDNQFGFYDRVSGNFFENSGTGAFVGGND